MNIKYKPKNIELNNTDAIIFLVLNIVMNIGIIGLSFFLGAFVYFKEWNTSLQILVTLLFIIFFKWFLYRRARIITANVKNANEVKE